MKYSFALMLIFISPSWVLSQVTLVESGPGTAKPGQTMTLTCTVTGYTISSGGYWHWIRQPPGKGLEWVAAIRYSGSTYYAPSLQSRISISKDDGKNQFSLQMSSLTAADSATYFCAREKVIGYDYFDYWGKGTLVTVTTASQTPPSLFPLIPSPDSTIIGNDLTVGCLAKDFLPDSLTLSWQNPNNASLEAGKIRRFPSITNSNGGYTTSSEATIPADQWKAFEPFYCKAELASQTRVARVVRQTEIICLPPEIVIRVPPLEEFRSANLSATLLCKAKNLHTERTTIKWLKEGILLNSGFTTSAPTRQAQGGYTISSELIVSKKDWYGDKDFSCLVQNEKFEEIRNVSKQSACEGCDGGTNVPVRVQTIPPSFADMYLKNKATITCRVLNIPFSADLTEMNVTWVREHSNQRVEELPVSVGQPQEQENGELVFVDVTAEPCVEDWDSGDKFLCTVKLPLLASAEKRSLRKQIDGNRHPPAVYVLPPSLEELALQETATLTCLMKGFSPKDFFVKWMRNDEPLSASEFYTSEPILESKSSQRYFAYSVLSVKEQDWSYGAAYTCMVGHEALPYKTTQKTIDKKTGKPSHVNVTLVLSDVASTCH